MKVEVLWLEDSFGGYFETFVILALILSFTDDVWAVAWKFILEKMGTLPWLFSNDGFILVINVVGGTGNYPSILPFIRPEHGMKAKVVIVDQVILVRPKSKLCLSDLSLFEVYNVVTVYDCASIFFAFCLVSQAYEDIGLFMELPSVEYDCFHLGYVRLDWDGSLKAIDLVDSSFALDDLVSLELKWVIMSRFEPTHGRIVVCLLRQMLICPFSFFGLETCNILSNFPIFHVNYLKRVWKVGKFVPIIIVPSSLLNAQIFGLGKCIYIRLIRFFVHKLMSKIRKFMGFEIQNCDSVLTGFHKDSLSFIEHAHSIHWNLELVLEQNLSWFVHMHHAVSFLADHCKKDEGFIVGCIKV